MKTVCLGLVLVALAGPASAQNNNAIVTGLLSGQTSLREISNRAYQQSPNGHLVVLQAEHDERDALNTASWVYVAAASADWSLTAVCARVVCFDEHSQTGLFLYGVERPALAIPIGVAIDVVWVYGIREFVAPDHPKLARALLYGSSAVRLVFTVSKINDLRAHAVRIR